MRTVYEKNLPDAFLCVRDMRDEGIGFSANLRVYGRVVNLLDVSAAGVSPLRAMQKLMRDPAAIRWKRELEAEMPDILSAA